MVEAKARGVPRLDAQGLLSFVLHRPRTWIAAHGEAELDTEQVAAYRTCLTRRAAGEPLAYLLAQKEFFGLMLAVNSYVLVPRPETELLVAWGLELLRGPLAGYSQPHVVDLGTGSGAIALAIKHAFPGASVVAIDASAEALGVARGNAARLSLDVALHQSDWWIALRSERFHLALGNPPYIAENDPHLAALRHEPMMALSPGGDGLGALAEIVAGSAAHLEPGAWLLLEHGFDQAGAVRGLFARYGFQETQTRCDLAGIPRCTGAHL